MTSDKFLRKRRRRGRKAKVRMRKILNLTKVTEIQKSTVNGVAVVNQGIKKGLRRLNVLIEVEAGIEINDEGEAEKGEKGGVMIDGKKTEVEIEDITADIEVEAEKESMALIID